MRAQRWSRRGNKDVEEDWGSRQREERKERGRKGRGEILRKGRKGHRGKEEEVRTYERK